MKKEQISTFKTLCRILPMIMKSSPLSFTLFVLIALLHGLTWGVMVNVTQYMFDTVEKTLQNSLPLINIWLALALFAAITLILQILTTLHSFMFTPFNEYSKYYFARKINQKIGKLRLICFEDPGFLNSINKADEGVNNIFSMAFSFIMLFTFFIPYIIYMAVYFWFISPSLSLIIFALAIPVFAGQKLEVKLSKKLEDQSAGLRRKIDYYKQCIYDPKYFKETRQLGLFYYFYKLFHSALDSITNHKKAYIRHKSAIQMMTYSLTFLGYMAVLCLMIIATLDGKMSVGGFSASFISLNHLRGQLVGAIGITGSLSKNVGSVNNLLSLFDMPERDDDSCTRNYKCDIKLKNVSFKYPDASDYSLKNVSLDINQGETIALVGENGAGKSSLIKLITGLYAPTEGEVILEQEEPDASQTIDEYERISAVFQKYQKYQLSLKENISISNIIRKNDTEDILQSLDKANFRHNSLKDGLDTVLSREFGGIELSGGQWQRVAIARGLFRKHDLIVMDEPTSAIDPIEESKVYEKFADMAKDSTAILVTHRLGSVKSADRIIVLDHGIVIETGTHEELMEKNGKYCEMFTAQAKWYR